MAEIREACELDSFFAVDWLLWRLTNTMKGEVGARGPARAAGRASEAGPGYAVRIDDWVAAGVAKLSDARLSAREQAIRSAHDLIASKLGALGPDELRELARLLNSDLTLDGRPAIDRFSPAFAGSFLAEVTARAEAANRWIEELWNADDDGAVARVLDAFWEAAEIPGAGISFPTAILHARDPERFFPLMGGLARGYNRMTGRDARGRSGKRYVAYCRRNRRAARATSHSASRRRCRPDGGRAIGPWGYLAAHRFRLRVEATVPGADRGDVPLPHRAGREQP